MINNQNIDDIDKKEDSNSDKFNYWNVSKLDPIGYLYKRHIILGSIVFLFQRFYLQY